MPRPSPRSRAVRVGAAGLALGLLLMAASARGQEPLARYVPKDNLVVYLEFDGLDAHADAWRKTAAYKILNDTPTGAMLEELLVQVVGNFPNLKLSGPEALALVKHVARSGFVFAAGGPAGQPKTDYNVLILRDAFKNKDIRPIVARGLQGLNGPNSKPQKVIRAGHSVVSGINPGGGTYTWWVEDTKKEDLLVVNAAPNSADFILETIDGKRPNAIDHPLRVELTKGENGFLPVFRGFVAARDIPGIPATSRSPIQRVDLRWGFQDDALMSVLRVASPSPRKGFLAMLDGPSFDKGAMPPLPDSLTGFTVVSVDLKTTLDRLVGLAKSYRPTAEDDWNKMVESIRVKTKLRLREDVLGRLGPKAAWYVLPAKAGAPPTLTAPNPLSMMMGSVGGDQFRKLALVMDVDDPAAFGKVLDELMAAANREIKAMATVRPGPGDPAAPAAKGGRGRGASGPSAEFRLMPGENKMYVLNLPPELAGMVSASLRPAIRIGPKHVALAVNAEVARAALEVKGAWAPPPELARAFAALPAKLKVLSVSDPRDTTPAILAALPGKLQMGINAILQELQPPPPAPAATAPNSSSGGGNPAALTRVGVEDRPGSSSAAGGSGGPGTPAAAAPAPASRPASIVLQVDAAKLPKADAIKGLLFSSVFTTEVDDRGFTFTGRSAFPDLFDPALIVPMIQGYKLGRARSMQPPPGMAQPTPPAGAAPKSRGGAGGAGGASNSVSP